MSGVLRRIGLGALVALILALAALNVLAWSGGLVEDEGPPTRTAPLAPGPEPEPARAEPSRHPAAKPIAQRQPRPRRRPVTVSVVLTASRGDCWVEARAGSATGETLYSGTLPGGRSLRFSRPKVWLRLGAASNVDLHINGRPSAVPTGTVELVLPDA
jgi:hypothetical protein